MSLSQHPPHSTSSEPPQMAGEDDDLDDDDVSFFDPSLFLNTNYVEKTFVLSPEVSLRLLTLPSASTDFDLTGQIAWPAATHLANIILKNPNLVKGRNVLELGSGLGIAGLSAARFCRHAILTDGNDTVMEVLLRNAELNAKELERVNRAEV